MTKPKLVLVDWVDAVSFSGWKPEAEWTDRALPACQTVAWMLSQDEVGIHLASTRDENDNLEGRFSIPRGSILSIKSLEVKRHG